MFVPYLFLMTLALANVGFEVEFSLLATEGEEWNRLGKLFRQKPLGTGLAGLFELQLDDSGERFRAEIVFPPTRMYKGLPIDPWSVEHLFCPALDELGEYLSNLEKLIRATYGSHSSSPLMWTCPGTSPATLSFNQDALNLNPRRGEHFRTSIQMTVGISADDFFPFFRGTFYPTASSFFNPHRPHRNQRLVNSVDKNCSSCSSIFKVVIFLLALTFIQARQVSPTPLRYLKMVTPVMSRTNLADLFQEITRYDREQLKLLSPPISGDTGQHLAIGLANLLKDIFKEEVGADPVNDNIINSRFFYGEDNIHDPIPLAEYCLNLVNGIDMFANLDDSMSQLPYLPSGEIVFEIRSFRTLSNSRDIRTSFLNLYEYMALFHRNKKFPPFHVGMSTGLCRGFGEEIAETKALSFTYSTELMWSEEGKDADLFGPLDSSKHLGFGPGGFWEIAVRQDHTLSIAIPPQSLYPSTGIYIPHRHDEITRSLQVLQKHGKKWDHSISRSQSGTVSLNIPGLLSFKDVSLDFNVNVEKDTSSMEGKLKIEYSDKHENIFPFLERILQTETIFNVLEADFVRFFDFLRKLSISNLSKLYLLELSSRMFDTNSFPRWTSRSSIPELFQLLSSNDLDYFQSLSHEPSSGNLRTWTGIFQLFNENFPSLGISVEEITQLSSADDRIASQMHTSYLDIHCNSAEEMIQVVILIQQMSYNMGPIHLEAVQNEILSNNPARLKIQIPSF